MKKWLLTACAVLTVSAGLFAASSNFSDLWTINGQASLRNTAIAWIDSSRHINLYDGSYRLDGKGVQVTKTGTNYQAFCVRVKNNSGATLDIGDVLLADPTTADVVTKASVTSTTTVLGVAVESITSGSMGFMAVSGYALIKTTGTVVIGNVLVSSAPATSAAKGYSGGTATPTSGTDIGVALEASTTDTTVLCKLR